MKKFQYIWMVIYIIGSVSAPLFMVVKLWYLFLKKCVYANQIKCYFNMSLRYNAYYKIYRYDISKTISYLSRLYNFIILYFIIFHFITSSLLQKIYKKNFVFIYFKSLLMCLRLWKALHYFINLFIFKGLNKWKIGIGTKNFLILNMNT